MGWPVEAGWPDLPDWANLPDGVKFCLVNVSRLGNQPSRALIRVTSNSRQLPLGYRRHCIINLKVTIESHSTERLQQKQQVRDGQNKSIPAIVLFTCLATIQKSGESAQWDGVVVRLHGWLLVASWGHPPPCKHVNRPLDLFKKGCLNNKSRLTNLTLK